MSFKNAKEVLTQVTIEMSARSPSRSTPIYPLFLKNITKYIGKNLNIGSPKFVLIDPLFKAKSSNYRKIINKK